MKKVHCHLIRIFRVGKGTVAKRLVEKYILQPVRLTTRKPREGEVDGRTISLSPRKISETRLTTTDDRICWGYVENFYGTPAREEELDGGTMWSWRLKSTGRLHQGTVRRRSFGLSLSRHLVPRRSKTARSEEGRSPRKWSTRDFSYCGGVWGHVPVWLYIIVNDDLEVCVDK